MFGGNFVHSASIVRQLQVDMIEVRAYVSKKYRFPYFKQINWLVLCKLLKLAQKRWGFTEDHGNGVTRDGDDDDEDEDLVEQCEAIKQPVVLRQFPYLVKICELWALQVRL